MPTAPAPYGHGRFHLRPLKPDFIVSGFSALPVVGEMRAVTLLVQSSLIIPDGHEEDVAEIVAPRSAQVRVAESVYVLVRVMVARTAVPVAGHRPGVGAQLDHAERPGRTRKSMSVEICPDKGVDVLCVIRRGCGCEASEQQCRQEGCLSHMILIVRVFLWHQPKCRHWLPGWPSWCRTLRRRGRRGTSSIPRSRSPCPAPPYLPP